MNVFSTSSDPVPQFENFCGHLCNGHREACTYPPQASTLHRRRFDAESLRSIICLFVMPERNLFLVCEALPNDIYGRGETLTNV